MELPEYRDVRLLGEGSTYTFSSIDRERDAQTVLSSLTSDTRTNRDSIAKRCQTLSKQGFTMGLAKEAIKEEEKVLFRHWILDNSGSMLACDGRVVRGTGHKTRMITTTRWAELQETVEYHAEMSGHMEGTSFFNLMNSPTDPTVPKLFSVAATTTTHNDIMQDVENVKRAIQKCQPVGPSPITPILLKVRDLIAKSADELRANGQKAVIILATDGLPTDVFGTYSTTEAQEFVNVLASIKNMPIWLVIRLCTGDQEVCNFYNTLDYDLELPLEVLDDFAKESEEVGRHNAWLNYAMPLHRMRERGSQTRVLDLLDERSLNKDEAKMLLGMVFGESKIENTPDVHDDWKGFIRALTPIVKQEGVIWNPRTRKMEPWIDVRRLDRTFSGVRAFLHRRSVANTHHK